MATALRTTLRLIILINTTAPLAFGDDDEPADNDSTSTDLPTFLTEDEPVAAALNGASAP
jgi:hypothetical protein